MVNVGIIGSTGYAGQQLVGLLSRHEKVNIKFLSSHSFEEKKYSEIYPIFKKDIDSKCINLDQALVQLDSIDVLFIALPHGKSTAIISEISNKSLIIIDLGADYRLDSSSLLSKWYQVENSDENLNEAIYGLPELNRSKIKKAKLIANPGCYPTATLLGLLPLLSQSFIESKSIIVDAKSGVTGAGRSVNSNLTYSEVNENLKAYSVAVHRHTPEIEEKISQVISEEVIINFTPHLVPMQRGILSTIYVTLKKASSQKDIQDLYNAYYKNEKFVRISSGLPETKHVAKTNYCDIGVTYDDRTNRVIIVSVIDNLMKGAAGQAVQNFNLVMGFEETLGLEQAKFYL